MKAIKIGEWWFAGFAFENGDFVVATSRTIPRLIPDAEVGETMRDLKQGGIKNAVVYDVTFTLTAATH